MYRNIPMVITDETKWIAYGHCRVIAVVGFNNNASDDRYLQFHEKPAALIAAGDVPAVKSLYFPAQTSANYGTNAFGNGGLSLSELSAAISSTEVNYTAVTNTGLDLTIVVDSEFLVETGTTLVGDLTTGVAKRLIWTEAAGNTVRKRLLVLKVNNTSGDDLYAWITAMDTELPSEISKDVHTRLKVPSGGTTTFSFGRQGITPRREILSGVNQGVYWGATVYHTLTEAGAVFGTPFEVGTDLVCCGVYE